MKKKVIIPIAIFSLALLSIGGYMAVAGKSPTDLFTNQLLFISGTEYSTGEAGSTMVRVTNNFGIGATANWCNVTIYNPDKTTFVTNQPMTLGGASGSWYYNWIIPNQIGNYEQYVACQVQNTIVGNSKASHASAPLTLVNQTLGVMNNTINQVNNTVTTISNNVNQLNNSLYSVNSSLSTEIGNVNQSLSNQITQNGNDIANVNNTVQQINSSISGIQNTVNQINDTLNIPVITITS